MPDITMCSNNTCFKKDMCYRFKAVPSEWRQSYADFSPNEKGECEYFWKLKNK